jgi:hypothetical protein
MAGGDHELRRIGGIDGAKCAGLACDAGIDPAVRRAHREVVDRSLRHAFVHGHFRRGIVSRADDEVSVGIGRRNVTIA